MATIFRARRKRSTNSIASRKNEVAKTAIYLVSDLASGVTGEVVHVDGGYHILGMFSGEQTGEEETR